MGAKRASALTRETARYALLPAAAAPQTSPPTER